MGNICDAFQCCIENEEKLCPVTNKYFCQTINGYIYEHNLQFANEVYPDDYFYYYEDE